MRRTAEMGDNLDHEPFDKLAPETSVSDSAVVEQSVFFPFAGQAEVEQWLRAEIAEQVRRETERLRKELEIQMQQQLLSQFTHPPEQTSLASSFDLPERIVTLPTPELREEKILGSTESSEEALDIDAEMLEIFRLEAEEHLQTISMYVAQIEHEPDKRGPIQGIRRATHVLKGAARAMDFPAIADLCHTFEDLLDQIMGGTIQINDGVLSLILDTCEALDSLISNRIVENSGDSTLFDVLRTRYDQLLKNTLNNEPTAKLPLLTGTPISETKTDEKLTSGSAHLDQFEDHIQAVAIGSVAADHRDLSVRIKLKKLDEVARLFDELLVNRGALDECMDHLMQLITSEGHNSEITPIIQEYRQFFQRQTELSSILQDQLLKMRLVALSMMVPSLQRAARATSLRQGKEIELIVRGEETEFDRTIYEEIAGSLQHLVRNAVTHGIEMPEGREALGKPRSGQIKLSVRYEGNQVIIIIQDDGAGINIEGVRKAAVERGLLDVHTSYPEEAILNLIFRPGVSTAEVISEESGRGLGLDVVSNAVARLRGTLGVKTSSGYGSTFTMTFPISLQIRLAALVRLGKQMFAIPMELVERIAPLDEFQTSKVDGEPYSFVHLASLLSLPHGQVNAQTTVLLVVAGNKPYALLVDKVVGTQEIVSKSFGSDQPPPPGVSGVTILGNGQVVRIIDLLELLSQQSTVLPFAALPGLSGPGGNVPAQPSLLPAAEPGEGLATPVSREQQCVLVVDDSPSVRRVVSNMLKQNGWEVQMARDGVEALEVAARQRSLAAMLVDIEMPRMDGYELIATLRSQEQYRHLPLIVLTSRAANKHKQRALELGADAYVTKPYQDEELLELLKSLVHRTFS
jgi:chemotaxis protein histidine kinase CheA/ActR/RegA family two-component response regulator